MRILRDPSPSAFIAQGQNHGPGLMQPLLWMDVKQIHRDAILEF